MRIVKSHDFTAPDLPHPRRQLCIVERENGRFSICEQYYYETRGDDGAVVVEGWARLPADGIYDRQGADKVFDEMTRRLSPKPD